MLLTVDLGTTVTKVTLWGEQGAVAAGRSAGSTPRSSASPNGTPLAGSRLTRSRRKRGAPVSGSASIVWRMPAPLGTCISTHDQGTIPAVSIEPVSSTRTQSSPRSAASRTRAVRCSRAAGQASSR